jgi:hypothetical protein
LSHFWGVDSALPATEELLTCVKKHYGKPLFWGRYLSAVSGVSSSLTRGEISFLHTNGIRILPIFNAFHSSVGLLNAKIAAQNAIYNARRLDVPFGKILFANVEHFFDVDASWIEGWFQTIQPSGYRVGYYHDPLKGSFNKSFCQAVYNNHKLKEQSILWSAEPEKGVSKKSEVPFFRPETVNCQSNTWGWQYGRNADFCPIDTNVVNDQLFSYLY